MEMPKVLNVVDDPSRKAQYHVMAYRKLSQQEMLTAVGMYVRQRRGKMAKNSVVTIITMIS